MQTPVFFFADDGLILYLNGAEIFRLGMAAGAVNFGLLATRSIIDPVYEGPFTIPVSNLLAGANVLAAEVHQSSTVGSDAGFADEISASLTGQSIFTVDAGSPPVLHLTAWGRQIVLTWDDAGAALESANAVSGPWTPVGTGSPYLISPANTAGFFRLRR